jgi:hypothetical protein
MPYSSDTPSFAIHVMSRTFQFHGIPMTPFLPLFSLDDAALAQRGIVRTFAEESPGYPCRVSLQEAHTGEELLLLNYDHQQANSPYRASGPIYVRRGAAPATLAANVVPESVLRRLTSVRAYDAAHMIIDAEICDRSAIVAYLQRTFINDAVAYIHVHYAKRGCYGCRVTRM